MAYSAPSHYLNQYWVIVNWTITNKLKLNFNQNTKYFIHKNAPENIVCEMGAILSTERWVKAKSYKLFIRIKWGQLNTDAVC